jgi:hypothetical protein
MLCERLIYCKKCGARLKRDFIGPRCPTVSCQWNHGIPQQEMTPAELKKAERASKQ